MAVFYKDNKVDVTSKDKLSTEILVKTVEQEIVSRQFEDLFGIFTRKVLDTGFQWEELEVANLEPKDFDPTGAKALTKEDLKVASIYHKINREKTFKTTVSNKQLKQSMLSSSKMASMANAITAELSNSSEIYDFESMKQLLVDICNDKKNMTICDLNGNGAKIDAIVKVIKTLATRMTLPSKEFNYMGFKKEFNPKDELVLIIDAATEAILDVDSLAGAFHMDKKSLVNNIIVIDKMPAITYTNATVKLGEEIGIGETNPVKMSKWTNSGNDGTVSGKAIAILCSRNALVRDKVEREGDFDKNGEGKFTNVYLHCTDVLSYSPLRNAVVLVD